MDCDVKKYKKLPYLTKMQTSDIGQLKKDSNLKFKFGNRVTCIIIYN